MSRILKAYEGRFRRLLQRVGTRRVDQGVQWLVERAQRLSTQEQVALNEALTRVHDSVARQLASHDDNRATAALHFFCDAGLGGLARWLRAAGYQAAWEAGIDDAELLRKTQELSAILLTTDSMLMERRVLRDGLIPSLWLPPTLSIEQQLAQVFCEFHLTVREPRCMSCGGELRRVDKATLRHRIPPRTFRWLDEYFVCKQCNQLFWYGTHWERIQRQLRRVSGGAP